MEKSVLKGLDVDSLSGLSTPFSRLCALEHETSLLSCIPETLTSAVSQIASITEVLNRSLPTGWKCNCLVSTSRLINEYCELATSQHEQLKRAGDSAEVSWRLGILDAASNIVDRQVSWHLDLAGAMAAEGIACPYEDVFDAGSSVLPLIPTHIGYTRRDNITPAEGLEKAQIISINEKGKQIADKVITINKLRLDSGEDRIFNLTETVFSGLFRLGDTVCSKEGELGIIIDALYFTFYENLKHIKLFLGDGDESKGDKLVRNDSVFGCIFDVKTIRSDLRHDLDHGKPNDVKKKLMNVGSCYQEYCGNRPLKPKDFKRLQERLYDKVISLEDSLIQMMAPSSFADCAG